MYPSCLINLISTSTASADSVVNITSGIDSTYNVYYVVYNAIHPSAGSKLTCQFTTNGSDFNLALCTAQCNGSNTEGGSASNNNADASEDQNDGTAYQSIAYADTIETNADVTDTLNVTAAGALMDSEVTNLAQVKAFDSSDYATAAQGTLADSALQSSDIGTSVQAHSAVLDATTASYTTAEETKLAAIEALADVTDTANVVAALTAGTNIAISAGGEISSTNTNTTYSVSVPAATTSIRLSGNDSSTDDIAIVGGTNVTVTRTDDSTLTLSLIHI